MPAQGSGLATLKEELTGPNMRTFYKIKNSWVSR
jgi:hypothetical protein